VLAGVAAVGFAFVAAGAGAGPEAPTLRVTDRAPLIVVGDRFAQQERVSVTVLTGLGPRTVRVTAARGRFRVEFHVPQKGCGAAFAVRARRASGAVVTATLGRPHVCVPPPRD